MPFSVDLDGEKHTKSLIGWSICLFELLASPPTKMFDTSLLLEILVTNDHFFVWKYLSHNSLQYKISNFALVCGVQ